MTRERSRTEPPTALAARLIALALALATVATPVAAAETYDVGTFVTKSDADYTPTAETVDDLSLCYIDDDGSTAYTPGEPLLLHFDNTCGEGAIDDRCLICFEDKTAGTEIGVDDTEWGRTLHAVSPHNASFVDLAGEGEVSDETPVYLDLFHVEQDRVDVGDVRLTGYGDHAAMTTVEQGDADLAFPLSHVGGSPTQLGDADVVYEAGDGIYLNVDRGAVGTDDTVVEDTDVRLNGDVEAPAGDAGSRSPSVDVTAVTVSPTNVSVGTPVRVFATVENTGTASGAGLVETRVGGQLVDARGTPTLAPGHSAKLVVRVLAPGQVGSHTVAVGGETASLEIHQEQAEVTDQRISALERRIVDLGQRVRQQAEDLDALETTVDASSDATDDTDGSGDGERVRTASPQATAGTDQATVPAPGVVVALLGLALVALARRRT